MNKKQLTLNQKEFDLLKSNKKDLSRFNIVIDNNTNNIAMKKTRVFKIGDNSIVKQNYFVDVNNKIIKNAKEY